MENVNKKMSEVEGQTEDLAGRGLGVTFLHLFLLSLAQIILLSALILLWVFAVLMQVWCSKVWCRKATREEKVHVIARGTKTREEQLAVFEPCPS